MFYYLIHNLPWGEHLQPGKRNVRTFIIGSVCYILLHALLFASKINFNPMMITITYVIRRYFWWIVIADALSMAITYKLAYGRNILTEIPLIEMVGEWIGGARDVGLDGGNRNIRPTDPGLGEPIEVKTLPDLSIHSTKLRETDLNSANKINKEDELDIDLLTENESLPDQNSHNIMTNEPSVSPKAEDNEEIDNTEPVANEVNNLDESGEPNGPDEKNEDEEEVDTPKLTSENINKYVINRSRLKLAAIDIKSEDLNL